MPKFTELTSTGSVSATDIIAIVANVGGTLTSEQTTLAAVKTFALNGNAASASKLASPVNLNGVAFDGSASITVPSSYTLPIATTSVLGGIKADGTSVTVDGAGVLTATYSYTLPTASTSVLGGVKVDGTSVTISSGVISAPYTYTLPTASTGTLGGVKVDGTTITITSGVISGYAGYSLPAAGTSTLGGVSVAAVATSGLFNSAGAISIAQATNTQLGGIKVDGTSITINSGTGVISATAYALPTAGQGSGGTLGGVRVDGSTVTIDANGVISSSVTAATTTALGGVKIAAVATSGINNTAGAISLATATSLQLGAVKIDDTTIKINSGAIYVPLISATKIAIGNNAGATGQGTNSIAIGYFAGATNQANNTIILNASGSEVNGVSAQVSSFYVTPVRSTGPQGGFLYYNTNSFEVSYSSSLGFVTGSSAGGSITQLVSRTTGVALDKPTGAITLFTTAGSITPTTFTVTNSAVAAVDTVIVNVRSSTNVYLAWVTAVAAGSFNITFYTTGGVSSDAPVFNFTVIKGSNN